ncbi:quinone oxidoreductase PIG3 isoform X3 [Lynx rufus]|uniref:quinone oxidoreductase PIG3 isoform X3 n=1 Tax=Lynx rufus TaxID=61384 RepID=UPI001F122D6E|nr:quinone oxidoreductase PIG3 isoform X3 [Lynx rufus]
MSSENMLAVHFDKPGGPENLYLKEVAKPSPVESEVLLKVAASALNRADLLQRQGQYPPPPGASSILGLEASGHIAALGPACQGHWKIGDPVMVLLPGGGQAQYVTVPEGLLMPIPAGLTLSQAAAIPEAWLTAFQLLHLLGHVQAGDSVLIHAGSSGVGTAAIQLARMAGAIPLVTAGSQHKLQMAEKLGAAAGFNYKEEDFSEATLKFTKVQANAGGGFHKTDSAPLLHGEPTTSSAGFGQSLPRDCDPRGPCIHGEQQERGQNRPGTAAMKEEGVVLRPSQDKLGQSSQYAGRRSGATPGCPVTHWPFPGLLN